MYVLRRPYLKLIQRSYEFNISTIANHQHEFKIQVLSEHFQAALIGYDEGIMSDDKVLAGALWRRFFDKKCDNYEHLEILVEYVRKQVRQFDLLNRQDFVTKPKIKWIDLTER